MEEVLFFVGALGAIAGALGGWWAGHGAASAARSISEEDDRHFRTHYDSSPDRLADRQYDHARPAYHLGHLAAEHPEYRGREFDAIEADLQKGWTDDLRLKYGDWTTVRGYAREGWSRRRIAAAPRPVDETIPGDFDAAETPELNATGMGGAASWGEHMEGQPMGRVNPAAGANLGGSPSHQRASFSDPVAAFADDVAGGVDPDARVERVAEQSGSPAWMSQPVDAPPGTRDAGAEARTDATEDADEPHRRRADAPPMADANEEPPHRRRADAPERAAPVAEEPQHRRRSDAEADDAPRA
jgi:hypothetical protein